MQLHLTELLRVFLVVLCLYVLLTKRARWLDIGWVLCLRSMDRSEVLQTVLYVNLIDF